MNKYFAVRISLQNLDNKNKLEYKSLYNQLKSKGFRDYYFINDQEYLLPEGMYAIMAFDYTSEAVLNVAEECIEKALKPYYPSYWSDKYTLLLSGPSILYNRNLEKVNQAANE